MPELIHTFTSGRMNKDLDERLVPNGEYRDALNLEISTSDTGNVGALQNIQGNTPKIYSYKNPSTGVYTEWGSGYINALVSPVKIGEIRDAINETIYWFISSVGVSAIAEYDQKTEVVVPVLVDTQGILNFSKDYLITGINIIEDLLFWTDNQTEPKVININDFKSATSPTPGLTGNFFTHTVFNGRDFIEEDITVIKKAPTVPLSLQLSETRAVDQDGNPAIVETTTQQNFVTEDPGAATGNCVDITCRIPMQIGEELTLTWASSPYPFYRVGDILTLDGSAVDDENFENEYQVRVEVMAVPPGVTQTYAEVKILVVPETVQDVEIFWEVKIDEPPFFEFKFPRFAYRYKYKDGYYSTFSPFSEIAFLPGEFDYETKKGYNLGMVNQLRQCIIEGFRPSNIPLDVVEVDLLYKESNSTSVYVVDTFIKGDDIWNANEFNIESEIISSILPSNQLLRNYDNVPRVAKSQEITGNRIVYGNYLQNFNLKDLFNIDVSPTLTQTITHNDKWDCDYTNGSCEHTLTLAGESLPKVPFQSIKSQRTYQVGVVFQDKYGRQTPVFTSESAATTLQKPEAIEYNQITAQTDGNVPIGFEGFRYYIKETSNEYYNLAMDRWYDAEDCNVWISFPSAERNKVDESTFLELKKRHDKDEFVSIPAKYKVVAISNEAPLFLRKVIKVAGSVDGSDNILDTGIPQPDFTAIDIKEDALEASTARSILDSTQKQRIVRVYTTTTRSNWYNVTSIQTDGSNTLRITIEGKFGDDMSFTTDANGNKVVGLNVQFATEDFDDKPEFEGRFFIKLYKDSTLQEYILSSINSNNYAVKQSLKMGFIGTGVNRSYITGGWGYTGWFVDQGSVANANGSTGAAYTVGGNDITVSFTGIWPQGADFNVGRTVYNQYRDAVDILLQVGGLFRFEEDPDQVIYEITATKEFQRVRNYENNSKRNKYNKGSNKRTRFQLKVKPIDTVANGTGLFQGPAGWSFPRGGNRPMNDASSPRMEFLTVLPDTVTFTSDNPGIFETEPKESAELELYYAASKVYPMSEYGNPHILDWHNCISFGNGVESDRVRDDYNAVTIDNGPIVSATLKEPYAEERRLTGLIYSQIFNSTSGVNNLNQFIQAEKITKDLNPIYSSIQKLHSRDTNLVALCEDKILRILANKDALFNADGNSNVTSNNNVLGQAVPYAGEFGISKNPESFASYGFRTYFTDKNRGVVLRLSNDGLEDISRYGMGDFYSDNLKQSQYLWGSFDDDKKAYNLCLDGLTDEWASRFQDRFFIKGNWSIYTPNNTVVSFKEEVKGWESRKTFSTEGGISLNDRYYTFRNGRMWEHRTADSVRNNFYGTQYDSSVDFLINEMPNVVKKYKTLNYSGSKSREYVYSNDQYSNLSLAEVEALQLQSLTSETLLHEGWYTQYMNTDLQNGFIKQFLDKENKYFQYIKGEGKYFTSNDNNNLDSQEFPMQGIGRANNIIAPPVTVFNVHVFGEPDCAIQIQPPNADNKYYEVLEDCTSCTVLTLTGSDPQGFPLTYEIASDNTLNGVLGAVNGDEIIFTPNVLNYYGGAGSFTYRSYNGSRYSSPATVDVEIISVPEGPVINSTPPAGPFTAGDPYSWTGITAIDPDHTLSELGWSVSNLPSTLQLTTTGNGFTGTASITGTVPQGTFSYTITVTDPDNLSDSLLVEEDGLVAALLNLDFVAFTGGSVVPTTWTDPNDLTFVVPQKQKASSGHSCGRGTYRLVANKHVNGGVVIGRLYVGNRGTTYFDSLTLDANGNPNSRTGDPYSHPPGVGNPIPSAVAQGNIDGLGNPTNELYANNEPEWGNDPNNSLQKYVTPAYGSNKQNYRISYLSLTEDQAQTVANDFPDTFNNCYVTFTFEPDTYNANGSFNTHADAVQFSVIQKGSTAGEQGGPEIFSGGLGTSGNQCQTGQPCDPALFAYVSFDVCTGAYLPDYDPLNPT